ncbi:MAG: 30S ribosomal protein S17 [Candidatus Riflebacteria bacterium]|nr:30S ribosomal protein S17 [Candidatus Riflebacteria bacterium]
MQEKTEVKTRGQSKVMVGTVLRTSLDKTIVVEVINRKKHALYKKTIRRKKRYLVHDEKNECGVGDRIELMLTRPISKLKRWRVSKIVAKAV